MRVQGISSLMYSSCSSLNTCWEGEKAESLGVTPASRAQPPPLVPAAAQHPMSTSRSHGGPRCPQVQPAQLCHSHSLAPGRENRTITLGSHGAGKNKALNDFHYKTTEAVTASRWKPYTDVAMTHISPGLTKILLCFIALLIKAVT